MYTVYSAPNTGSFVVELLLSRANMPYDRIEIDFKNLGHKEGDFLKINPAGQLPTMLLEDGTVMTETGAIVIDIADRYPAARMTPGIGTVERSLFLRWVTYLSSTLYPAIIRAARGARFTSNENGGVGVSEVGRTDVFNALTLAERVLGEHDWIVGDQWTAADDYLFMLSHWNPDKDEAYHRFPNLGRHVMRLRADPLVSRLNGYFGLWR